MRQSVEKLHFQAGQKDSRYAWRHLTNVLVVACLVLLASGCSRDDKSAAERDAEVQKAIQEGAAKERKMYEGMQKGMENMEKSLREQKEGKK